MDRFRGRLPFNAAVTAFLFILWGIWRGVVGLWSKPTPTAGIPVLEVAVLSILAAIVITALGRSHRRLKAELDVCRRTENRLNAILDNMSDGVMVADTTGRLELINSAAQHILGLRDTDASLNQRMMTYAIFHADGRTPVPVVDLPLMRAVAGHATSNEEIVVRCPVREIDVPICGRARPIFERPGELAGGVYVFHDITERKRSEEFQRHQLAQLKRLTSAAESLAEALQASSRDDGLSDDSTVLATIAGTLDCNWAAVALCMENGLVDWRSVLMNQEGRFLTPSRLTLSKDQLSQILCEDLEDQVKTVVELETPHGTIRNAAWAALSHQGRIRGTILVGLREKPYSEGDLDVLNRLSQIATSALLTRRAMEQERDARLQAEEELTTSLARLERLTQANSVGEMTAGIAHELNQPLTALINYTDGILALATQRITKETQGDLTRLAQKSHHQAVRAAEVIRSVGSLIRRQSPQKIRFDVLNLVHGTLKLLEKEVQQTKAAIAIHHDTDPIIMWGDATQIQQLIANLVRNASVAVSNQPERNIDIAIGSEMGAIVLTVADTGTGIRDQDLPHLFDAFFTTRDQGLGFGLKICRSIAELHGGQIRAANNKEGGATFTATFPLECLEQGAA